VEHLCDACQVGKQRCTSFPMKAEYWARWCLELVHNDLCAPITLVMLRGNKYFLLLVDDLTQYMWVVAIPSKDRVVSAIKEIQARAEGESYLKLRALHTDHRGEFTTTEFTEYCMAEGVHHQHTPPCNPHQNDVIEHRNGMVVATTRSLLKAKGLLRWF
jgi:transposase InsO family protein